MKLLIDYLKRDVDKFGSGLGHHRLLLAAVDCVWCTVVGNAVVEDMFLEQEGVLVLLDVLSVSTQSLPTLHEYQYMPVYAWSINVFMQKCPENMKNLVLGVLVDLCENSKVFLSQIMQIIIIVYYPNNMVRPFHTWQRGGRSINVQFGLSLPVYGEMKNRKWKYREVR